jgi:SOS-response transcriptional repressor LexA
MWRWDFWSAPRSVAAVDKQREQRGQNLMNERDYQTLAAIALYISENGFSPSMRDLIDMTDHPSTSMVSRSLQKLHHAGLILRAPRKNRAIAVTEAGYLALSDILQEAA